MQKPFMKLFSTVKHGQVLVMMNNLDLSVTWKVDHTMYVGNFPDFNNIDEIQGAFDTCTRETIEAFVSNVKFLDEDIEGTVQ